jgi:hypothetical protein
MDFVKTIVEFSKTKRGYLLHRWEIKGRILVYDEKPFGSEGKNDAGDAEELQGFQKPDVLKFNMADKGELKEKQSKVGKDHHNLHAYPGGDI